MTSKEEKSIKKPRLYDRKEKYYMKTPKEILQVFNQSIETGYSKAKAEELSKTHGLNELDEEEKETIFEKIVEQFQDTLVRILLGAAVISFIIALTDKSEGFSAYVEPFVILLILIANAAIGIIQDLNADSAIEALKKMQECNSIVKRDGEFTIIDSKYLVPGDIVRLTEGEKVPADIQLLEINSINFQVDQSALTGETNPVYKDIEPIKQEKIEIAKMDNTAFSSSGVVLGSAIGIVISIGMNTEIGKIQDMITENKENEAKTPLKQKIEEFGDILTYLIGIICIVVWVINYKNFFDESHGTWINGCIYYFKISVALAVAAIPEGLPAVITTCLALGSTRLSRHKAIVKKLYSIETLGCTSVICSDKTGTLTTNNMTVTKVLALESSTFSNNDVYTIKGSSFNPDGEIENFNSKIKNIITEQAACITLNNLSKLIYDDKGNKYTIIGTPTEGALRVLAEKLSQYDDSFKGNKASTKECNPYEKFISSNYEIVYTLDFDRKRKAKSVFAIDKKTNKPIVFIKGAVEYMIKKSKTILTANGEVNLNDTNKALLNEILMENFTTKSLRTLAICSKTDLSMLNGVDIRDQKAMNAFFSDYDKILELESEAKIISIVGMLDPPRPEVKAAIETCHKAGIRVLMITGDERETAKSIGLSIGLIDKEDAEESTFVALDFFKDERSVAERKEILKNRPKLIFSRSEPQHKQDLVDYLKELNLIVAMTGDGTNDAPALSKANIGIAMGIAGTEVTKSAAHMVLADDNFATIVKAVEEGRSIYMNMKAFIRYLISSNIGEVVSIFISSIFGLPEAFTSIQLLWVNLVTDGPPATALSFNPTEKDIMTKPPRGR